METGRTGLCPTALVPPAEPFDMLAVRIVGLAAAEKGIEYTGPVFADTDKCPASTDSAAAVALVSGLDRRLETLVFVPA